MGYYAGRQNSGINQTALGYAAGYQNNGDYQTAMGYAAGSLNSGAGQTAIGYGAGSENSGDNQTAIGHFAGFQNSGAHQTAIGYFAGRYIANGATDNTNSVNAVYLGANTRSLTANDNNIIVIGTGAIGKGSNTAVWGNTNIETNYFSGDIMLPGWVYFGTPNAANSWRMAPQNGTNFVLQVYQDGSYTNAMIWGAP